MARKIPEKLIREYRAMQLSRNLIAKTQKAGRNSVSDVFKRTEDLGLNYEDVESSSETEGYQKLFPDRHQSVTTVVIYLFNESGLCWPQYHSN